MLKDLWIKIHYYLEILKDLQKKKVIEIVKLSWMEILIVKQMKKEKQKKMEIVIN